MTKFILSGGRMYKAVDQGRSFAEELIKGFSNKPVKILICFFAQDRELWSDLFTENKEWLSTFISGFEIELALPENFTEQVKKSDVIFLKGGKVKQIFDILEEDKEWMAELADKTVVGLSAGADVLCKHYYVLSTRRLGDGFGLLPVKFIPHWKADDFFSKEDLVDWNKILEELKNYKEDLPIYTLKEGEFVVFNQ